MLEMLASQLLLPCSATKGKESQTLGGGGDPPQGAFDGMDPKIQEKLTLEVPGSDIKTD